MAKKWIQAANMEPIEGRFEQDYNHKTCLYTIRDKAYSPPVEVIAIHQDEMEHFGDFAKQMKKEERQKEEKEEEEDFRADNEEVCVK